ncbi:DnaJ domain-containing protein [Candidatus Aminicenantes bacterium AH-873-B07]|jgi:curved DNA-binding protein CbpA|nr:DnaJ domain-containing protein [Candidatus Aminicenantes bacterium AH-873-B07]
MKKSPLPIFLKNIYLNRKSGILKFKYQEIEKTLYLKDGHLIFAETNQESERLGQILFKLDKISETHLKKIHLYIEKDKKLGKALVEKGIISPRDLYEAWINQMEEIVTNMFLYFDAEFDFEERDIKIAKEFTFKISLPFLIAQGIRKMGFSPKIKEIIGKGVPYLKDNKEYINLLNNFERELLNAINGFTSIDKLFPLKNISSEDFWKSMFLFYCLDLIDFKEGEEFGTEEKKNLEEILALERELDSLNYYQILKISPSASPEEIKRAYFTLAKLYHPDRFARNASPEVIKKAQRVFVKITKAYETLIDLDKRKEYDASSIRGKVNHSKELELKFRKAKALYKQRKYREAIALIKEILKFRKDKGSYFLLLALCQSKIPAFHKEAEENFYEAIKLEPWNPECYVGLGLLYKSENMLIRASRQFEKALSIDSEHPIAKKELELIRGKKEKFSLRDLFKGDLSSLFKKRR